MGSLKTEDLLFPKSKQNAAKNRERPCAQLISMIADCIFSLAKHGMIEWVKHALFPQITKTGDDYTRDIPMVAVLSPPSSEAPSLTVSYQMQGYVFVQHGDKFLPFNASLACGLGKKVKKRKIMQVQPTTPPITIRTSSPTAVTPDSW